MFGGFYQISVMILYLRFFLYYLFIMIKYLMKSKINIIFKQKKNNQEMEKISLNQTQWSLSSKIYIAYYTVSCITCTVCVNHLYTNVNYILSNKMNSKKILPNK